MGQSCTSMSFAGVHRRVLAKERAALQAAIIAANAPDAPHWQNEAARLGETLVRSLPEHIDPIDAWECLGTWADESPARVRAEGYQRGLDYLTACARPGACAADLDVLLRQIRGRLYVAHLDLTAEHNHAVDDAEAAQEAQYARDMRAELHN